VPVGTAAFYDAGDGFAWLDFSTTHPDYRKRGVQAALLIHTMNAAREAGCRTLVIETAEDTPRKVAPSYRNAIKFGFEEAYVRPNYIHTTGVTGQCDSRTVAQTSKRAMSHSGFARTRSEGSVAAT
jgi:ribosomal protein S18 acetylase RimI-like enzyme